MVKRAGVEAEPEISELTPKERLRAYFIERFGGTAHKAADLLIRMSEIEEFFPDEDFPIKIKREKNLLARISNPEGQEWAVLYVNPGSSVMQFVVPGRGDSQASFTIDVGRVITSPDQKNVVFISKKGSPKVWIGEHNLFSFFIE